MTDPLPVVGARTPSAAVPRPRRTPLANAYVHPSRALEADPTYPLAVAYCGSCHLVQLTETVPPASSSRDTCTSARIRIASWRMPGRWPTNWSRLRSRPVQPRPRSREQRRYLLQFFQAARHPGARHRAGGQCRGTSLQSGHSDAGRCSSVADLVARTREEFGRSISSLGNNVLAHVPTVNDSSERRAPCLQDDGVAVFEFPYLGDLLVENGVRHDLPRACLLLFAVCRYGWRARLALDDVRCQSSTGPWRLSPGVPGSGPPPAQDVARSRAPRGRAARRAPRAERYRRSATCPRHCRRRCRRLQDLKAGARGWPPTARRPKAIRS